MIIKSLLISFQFKQSMVDLKRKMRSLGESGMLIIISPAKKMREDSDGISAESLPVFLQETEELMTEMRRMSQAELQLLWRCNASIAAMNWERLKNMDLHEAQTPAVLAYDGIQYQYMAPRVFEYAHLEFIRRHLRILSGFYGLLRPFDGVTSYRLEMQARLAVGEYQNLYSFWGNKLALKLAAESDLILNLASKEYSKAVKSWLPENTRFLTCIFGERKNGIIVEKGTACKIARGQMVRWLAENDVTAADDFRGFSQLGYQFSAYDSNDCNYIFVKDDKRC